MPIKMLVLGLVFVAGCGGAQTVEQAAPPPPAPAPSVQPARVEVDARTWYVFWEGIHVMTVYANPGLIRSEEAGMSGPPWGERSAHFSILSHYVEQEDLFGPSIAQATSVDDLIARLATIPTVEIQLEELRVDEM